MILSAIAEKLKRRSKDDFKGRHFQASLILQAVSWYLRYSLSYRDIEELFLERGLAVDHSTLNRWVLAYAPLIERRLRAFRKPHCGSIRIDMAARKDGLLPRDPLHYVTKHLQQGIESDHFRVKRPMPRIGGFQSFHTARRTIRGFEAMLWLRKGFGFAGAWTVCEQNRLLSVCFGLPAANKA
jgi:transposase-like protein